MVNKYSYMWNHATCVGTLNEERIWVGRTSMIYNNRRIVYMKTRQTNKLININLVLNIMGMIWKYGIMLWKCFCECKVIFWNILRLLCDWIIIIQIM